ncbi:MAG: PAS domain S-box protein [Candidatus Kapaibacterium sp.]
MSKKITTGSEGHIIATSSLRDSEERYRLLVEGMKDYAIFMLDPDGYITSWNAGAERIKGYTAGEAIGRHFSMFYSPQKIEEKWPQQELEFARRDGRFEDEGWRLRRDGTRLWANVIITALYDEHGELLGYSKITRDLTERKEHEETLRRSEERFRLLVEGVKDYAIFMLDPDGYITSWNAGAEGIKGYTASEAIGQHFSMFYPREKIEEKWPEQELEFARRDGRFEDEGWRLRKDGTRLWANVIITPLYDKGNRLIGFSKVTRDMTERKRVEELELAEQRMTEFLAMLSHELRNPLAPIRNAVYMMQLKESEDADLAGIRDILDRQVEHITRLVDDLVEVSRVTSGTIRLRREQVDIHAIIARATESSRPFIEARGHRLEIILPNNPILLDGDQTRLVQVFVNLLNNAAKYTPGEGTISVIVEEHGHEMVARVRDTGAGISADLLPNIFDLFTQGERTLDRSEGGLGIGLTLARRIIEMHGGTIKAFSEGAGMGSELLVCLPIIVAETSAAGAIDMQGVAESTVPEPLHVLVVDDNIDAARSMTLYLKAWGYDVRIAHDGPTALAIAAEHRPDVVLLDIGLPGMSGYDVAVELRKLNHGAEIEIVAVTGYGQEEDRRRTREAGIDHHMVKPIDPRVLRTLLAGVKG